MLWIMGVYMVQLQSIGIVKSVILTSYRLIKGVFGVFGHVIDEGFVPLVVVCTQHVPPGTLLWGVGTGVWIETFGVLGFICTLQGVYCSFLFLSSYRL